MVFGAQGGCIGRGSDNEWVLPDPQRYLSLHHARVRCVQGTYLVEDTSTNGVFLNGARKPLGKGQSPPLRHGDRLRLGNYELQVSIAESTPETEADIKPLTSESVEALLIDYSVVMPAPKAAPLIDRPVPAVALNSGPLDAAILEPPFDPQPTAPTAPAAALVGGDRRRAPRHAEDSSPELDAFCRGAGIAATELPSGSRLAVFQIAGMLLREALLGARELAKSRREILRSAGLNPDADDGGHAALQRYSIEELLKQLLTAKNPALPEAIPWVREVFSNARRNDAAFVQASRCALVDYLRRLDPAVLKQSGDAAERFRLLTEVAPGASPALYTEALARHFAQLIQSAS
jgi:type VI secretion system protein